MLAAALAVTLIALVVVLSGGPAVVTRSVPMTEPTGLGTSELGERICQDAEVLPRATTAIRVWLEAVIGPPVSVEALSGGRVLTRGARSAGWTTGSVTIPVTRVARSVSHVTICVHVGQPREPIGLQVVPSQRALAAVDRQGPLAPTAHAGAPTYREGPLPGRIVIEYLRPSSRTWWSLALSVARRMGLGHAGSGTWIPLLALILMVVVATLMSWLILRELA